MREAVKELDLRQNLRQYLERVQEGETLEILDGGTPVAVLAPLPRQPEAIKRLAAEGRLIPPRLSLEQVGEPVRLNLGSAASEALLSLREGDVHDPLEMRPPAWVRWGGVFGGVLLGGAISNLLAPADLSRVSVLLTTLGASLGIFFLALDLAFEWIPRRVSRWTGQTRGARVRFRPRPVQRVRVTRGVPAKQAQTAPPDQPEQPHSQPAHPKQKAG